MYKMLFIVLTLCSLNSYMLWAQKQTFGTINGNIVEKETNKPVEFANVIIRSIRDSIQIKGTVTDKNGAFTFEHVPEGMYEIVYSFIGFEKQKSPVIIVDKQHTIISTGSLSLKVTTSELKEVVVTGEKSTYVNTIDRKTFNVGKDLVGTTGSVSDLLQNVPSVTVDMDGNVNLRGSDNVMILINGKPSAFMGTNRAAALQQMPANSIDKIEVITNPSAKYKPDGTSGIINIVLKKNKSLGFNGTVMANASNDNRYNGNIIANYNSGKVNLFGSYSARQDDRLRYNTDNRIKTDSTIELSYISASSTDKSRPFSQIANAGIDFKMDDENRLGFTTNYNYRSFNRLDNTRTQIEDVNHLVTKDYERDRRDPEFERDLEFSANYLHSFKKEGNELSVDYTSSLSKEIEDNHYSNIFYIPPTVTTYDNTLIKQGDNESELSVDYVNPLTKNSTLEAGYVFDRRKNDMDYSGEAYFPESDAWLNDTSRTNHFIYTENIHVVYSTFKEELGKFGILAGLRAEQTSINSNQVTYDSTYINHYFRLYPSLHLSYKITDVHELQLNYSHRIRRPEGDDMNPFPEYQDPYNLRVGNPKLKPEEIHSVEFGYQFKTKNIAFISTLYYRYLYNGFTSITKYLNDSVLLRTHENLSNSQSTGVELILTSTIAKVITANFSTNSYWNTIDASSLGYSANKSAVSTTANLNLGVNLTGSTLLQITSNYSSKTLTPQGYRFPSYVMNMGLKQEFMKKKAYFLFAVSDVFNSLRQSWEVDTPELYQKVIRKRSARLIYAGFSYTFGKQNKKQKDNGIKFDNQL